MKGRPRSEVPKLNTPDERCTCQVRRLGLEGWGKTCPPFFGSGGALLDLIGGLLG